MKKLSAVSLLYAVFSIFSLPAFARSDTKPDNSQRVHIYKAFSGELETHISGVTESSPPYIKVIRSEEGLEHMLKEFSHIKHYMTYKKVRWLKKDLRKINLNRYMLIAILTEPVDNYAMEFKGLYKINEEKLEVRLSYEHKDDVIYSLTPNRKIHYKIFAVKKNDLPIVLRAENTISEKVKKRKPPLKYISGKLFAGKDNELRLISPRPRKGIIYYIRGDWALKLREYAGKKVTLRGRISNRREGLYEVNFEVDKIIRIHDS